MLQRRPVRASASGSPIGYVARKTTAASQSRITDRLLLRLLNLGLVVGLVVTQVGAGSSNSYVVVKNGCNPPVAARAS